MNSRKTEAESLRIGLLAGIVTQEDVITWADHVIEEESRPHPTVIEVSLSAGSSSERIANLLEDIPGESPRVSALRLLLKLLLDRLNRTPEAGRVVAESLYRLASAGGWPEEVLGGEAYWLDDLFQPECGTPYDDAVQDLREYLESQSSIRDGAA